MDPQTAFGPAIAEFLVELLPRQVPYTMTSVEPGASCLTWDAMEWRTETSWSLPSSLLCTPNLTKPKQQNVTVVKWDALLLTLSRKLGVWQQRHQARDSAPFSKFLEAKPHNYGRYPKQQLTHATTPEIDSLDSTVTLSLFRVGSLDSFASSAGQSHVMTFNVSP
mmetsp:Transcript_11061/g.22655  ORF Transcript_11061/g.22655 Transcript_11061/m.22655 type:complete len:165 (+) Transcript_11061:1014-1508(+)